MHDLDRTFRQFEGEFDSEAERDEYGRTGVHPLRGEPGVNGVIGEAEVQEMAAELLSVSNEEELDYFLTDLIKKAGSAIGSAVESTVGRPLGGVLKSVAKQALPLAGAALGNMIAPGIGGVIGGKLASTAGSLFGLELEGLSQEEGEYEAAKQFVRLGIDAASQAAQAAEQGQSPHVAVRDAVVQAAHRYAPGLLQAAPLEDAFARGSHHGAPDEAPGGPSYGPSHDPSGGSSYDPTHAGRRQHGRWVRRGHHIILLGV